LYCSAKLAGNLPEGRHRVDVYFPELESSTSDGVTIEHARASKLHLRP